MAEIKWVEMDPDDIDERPLYGPQCPGPEHHTWSMGIMEGQMALSCGCSECEEAVLAPVNGEDVEMDPILGKLTVHVERSGYYDPEYTCWWEFVPEDS